MAQAPSPTMTTNTSVEILATTSDTFHKGSHGVIVYVYPPDATNPKPRYLVKKHHGMLTNLFGADEIQPATGLEPPPAPPTTAPTPAATAPVAAPASTAATPASS